MKITKPTTDDINAAFELAHVLKLIVIGYHPKKRDEYGEPAWIDEEELPQVMDILGEAYEECNLDWLMLALHTLTSKENGLIDPDAATLEIHPSIIEAKKDAARLDWMILRDYPDDMSAEDRAFTLQTERDNIDTFLRLDAEQQGAAA